MKNGNSRREAWAGEVGIRRDGTALTGSTPSKSLNSGDNTATALIVMKNTGDKPWQRQDTTPHRLGSIGDNHDKWGANRRDMSTALVEPEMFSTNNTANFAFTFTIPEAPGTYTFQWKLLEEGVVGDPFFESATPAVTITVIDTTPPTAPSALHATNVSAESFRLNWTASIEKGPVLSYDVYRTVNGVMTFIDNTTSTEWDFTQLRSGDTYQVKVIAKDGAIPVLTTSSETISVTTYFDPNLDNDDDGVSNGVEQELGLDWNNPNDVRMHKFTYDKINQLKSGPGGQYIKDAEGNIKEVRP